MRITEGSYRDRDNSVTISRNVLFNETFREKDEKFSSVFKINSPNKRNLALKSRVSLTLFIF